MKVITSVIPEQNNQCIDFKMKDIVKTSDNIFEMLEMSFIVGRNGRKS